MKMEDRVVVITGVGSVSGLGMNCGELWAGLCEGACGMGPITAFDAGGMECRIAGEVEEFKVKQFLPKANRKAAKLMSRDIKLSIAAADEAVRDSGITTKAIDAENVDVDPTRFGINFGAGLISCDLEELAPAASASGVDGEFDIKKWGTDGLELVTPLWLLKYLPNMLPCHVGLIHDVQGPSNTITCAEVSGHLAIGEAVSYIKRGVCDLALTGGAEAKVNPILMIRQCLIDRAVKIYNDRPCEACRPFDKDAAGSVFGEGAGILVVESKERAVGRGAKIYAEIAGIGQSYSQNKKMARLEADGKGVEIAIQKAMEQAGITAGDIDLIIPHGTGIAEDDLAEARGITAAMGDAIKEIAVLPTKSMVSNTGAAAGAIDVIVAAKAMEAGKIPAAKNCEEKAEGCELNIVKETMAKNIRYALCCSYTYGGETAAVVLKKSE